MIKLCHIGLVSIIGALFLLIPVKWRIDATLVWRALFVTKFEAVADFCSLKDTVYVSLRILGVSNLWPKRITALLING